MASEISEIKIAKIVTSVDEELERTRPRCPPPDATPFRPQATDFGEAYVLPEHREKTLAMLNPFLNKEKLTFLESPHLYIFDGQVASASVSSQIKPYVEEFDADAIIGKMVCSRREAWPRLKYAVGAAACDVKKESLSSDELILVVKEGLTTFAGRVGDSPPEVEGEELYFFERAMSREEIKASWDSPHARNMGTEAHLSIENFFNGEAVYETAELKKALLFAKNVMVPNGVEAYGTEVEIYGRDEDLAGSIDFIGRIKGTDEFVIFDWKRSIKLHENIRSKFNKKMAPPLNHLHDCDVCKYTFQLSIYSWMLQKYYNMKISKLCLINVHPDSDFFTFVPYLKPEVEYLMSRRREIVALRAAVLHFFPDAPICSISGTLAYDACRLTSDCSIASKRYALSKGLAFAPDPENARIAENRMRQLSCSYADKFLLLMKEDQIPWTELMPLGGIQKW